VTFSTRVRRAAPDPLTNRESFHLLPDFRVLSAILVAVSSISRRNSFLCRNRRCGRRRLASPIPTIIHSRNFPGSTLVEGVAEGSFSSVPVGIRVSVSASEGTDEGPNDIDQLRDEVIERSIPKLELKRSNDVSDLLIQIENRGSAGLTRRGRAMPTSRSCQPCLRYPRLRHQCCGLLLVGQGERHGLSGGPVLPLRVVIPLTFQALPIRAGLHGGSRGDGLERQDQPIWFMMCGYKKSKATLESN